MSKPNYSKFGSLLFALLFLLSTSITAWAGGPSEGIAETKSQEGTSAVITCGAGDAVSETAAATLEAPPEAATPAEGATLNIGTKGTSLGMFTTTGYCNCSKCSGGHNLTYSGTVPTAKRTISADLSKFPIGTKLMVGDVIYTVEDMGSSVKGNWLDIYYASHQEAVHHGMKTEEVFAVVE